MRISQSVFRSASERDTAYQVKGFDKPAQKHFALYANRKLIKSSVKFKIVVPIIHKTVMYNDSIVLRNDSLYNPYGSDNTIWNSSLPDIYWALFYPKDIYYCSSPYQTSTIKYDGLDTFAVYHYFMNDTIAVGVYDHDNLSRDDVIGFKNFSLGDVRNKKVRQVTFDGVKSFSLRAEYKGVVNK